MHELILGGAKSGKSRAAEARALAWRAAGGDALLIATATAGDDAMRARIERHRADRALRAPGLAVLEEPLALPQALAHASQPGRLVVVDCLTLWLTNLRLPLSGTPAPDADAQAAALPAALAAARGPVLLVSNEIGLGVLPLTDEARRFVDALGLLHQAVATLCSRVTLMVAGLPLAVKS